MGYVPGSETNNIPFGVPLALGKYTELQGVNKFGYNDAVPNTFETVWDNSSVYTWLTSASVITVTSSSTDDNGGTVCVIGLDENLLPVEEVLTIGGDAGVITFLRVHRLVLKSANTGTTNVGVVSASAGVIITSQISVGIGQSLMALYTVPAGYRGFILSYHASASKQKELSARLLVRPQNGLTVWNTIGYDTSFGTPICREYQLPTLLTPGSDIELQCKVDAISGVSAGFELLLEKI